MDSKIIHPNFIYPELPEQHYQFGSGQLKGTPLREDGDWRDFLPLEEVQNINGVESSACYINAEQNGIATLLEEMFAIKDSNFSSRFNVIRSQGTMQGGDPILGIQSIKNDGVIDEAILPFTDAIKSWWEFASYKGGDEALCLKLGQEWASKWRVGYDIVFTRDENPERKYLKLREALKYSPVCMSVMGWYSNNGVYIKPPQVSDNHLCLCVYLDEQNRPYFWDTYSPHLKVGEPFYNSDFALRLSVDKKEVVECKQNWWDMFINWLNNIF